MGLFTKHCPVCGMDIDKGKTVKRFGKYFCSENHAEEYRKKQTDKDSGHKGHGGGCCG